MEVYDRVEERISRRTRLYTSPGEESGNGTDGKVGIVHGSVEPAKRHTHTNWPINSRQAEGILYERETDRDLRSA